MLSCSVLRPGEMAENKAVGVSIFMSVKCRTQCEKLTQRHTDDRLWVVLKEIYRILDTRQWGQATLLSLVCFLHL